MTDSTKQAMQWERLICNKRLGMERYRTSSAQTRSDFQRDFDRLVFSSPFRRLQNKTQVFPLPGSIFVHNRLTHSLEVSSVGKSLANEVYIQLQPKYAGTAAAEKLSHIVEIVGAACLAHDMGNPPFGHSGERTIATYFSEGRGQAIKPLLSEAEWNDFVNFDGNANSFRLLAHQFRGRREGGLAMTYSSLAAIVNIHTRRQQHQNTANSDFSSQNSTASAWLPPSSGSSRNRPTCLHAIRLYI